MIYLLGGDNTYLSSIKLNKLLTDFQQANKSESEIIQLDGENVQDLSDLFGNYEGFSIFSSRRLFVVKRFLSNKNGKLIADAADYLASNQSQTDLIFWEDRKFDKRRSFYKVLNKIGLVENFDFLKPIQLRSWVQREFDRRGILINNNENEDLILRLGREQYALLSAIDLLTTYLLANNESVVRADLVEQLIPQTIEMEVWGIIDAISNRQTAVALKLIDNSITDIASFLKISALIARQLRILATTRELLDNHYTKDKIKKELRLHPFVLTKTLSQAQRFTIDRLRVLYQKLVNTDVAVKTGRMDPRLAMDLFVTIV